MIPKPKAIVKLLEAMFSNPRRVAIPESNFIVWMQNDLTQFKQKLPGKWLIIAYRLPEEAEK